jgi:hypothetical protein
MPTFATQIAILPLSISYYFHRHRAARRPLLSIQWLLFILLCLTAIYVYITCYILINIYLFLILETTIYEFYNERLFTLPFATQEDMHISVTDQDAFQKKIQDGKRKASQSRMVIGCTCRNIANNLPNEIVRLETIGQCFKDYRIIIYENDSSDGTRDLLLKWAGQNHRVEILSCCEEGSCDCILRLPNLYNIGKTHDSQERIEKMRIFRQRVLFHAQQMYGDFDYFLVRDMDLIGAIYLDGFLTSFANDEWDSLAYIGSHDSYNQHTGVRGFLQFQRMHTNYIRDHPIDNIWFKCRSGFNGMAVYQMRSIQNAMYPPGYHCEHISLHVDMAKKGYDRVYMNPAMILFVQFQGPPVLHILKDFIFK